MAILALRPFLDCVVCLMQGYSVLSLSLSSFTFGAGLEYLHVSDLTDCARWLTRTCSWIASLCGDGVELNVSLNVLGLEMSAGM